MTVAGATSAHDGQGCDKNGWSHDGQHHMSMLSDDKRQLLHETMKKVFEQDKGVIDQMHKLHKDMHEVLAADTFDAHKFMVLGDQLGKLRAKLHRDRMQAFASIASQFTPEERTRIVKFIGHHHHHHHGGWRDHSMNDGPEAPPNNANYHSYQSR
jgi:Spy/CpxP family protein refolding chaperone